VAKFRGDWSRELGDLLAKEKKTSRVKHKAFGTNVPGGLIRNYLIIKIRIRTEIILCAELK